MTLEGPEDGGVPGFIESVTLPIEGEDRQCSAYMTFKRVADTVLAMMGLLALSPFLLLVAVLIKLTSRGGVFFRHDREGRKGRVFRCLKFRTMIKGAHALQRELYSQNVVDGPQFKLASDPRETRLGRWLRRINIDELPQLINVFLGQMSLVGPRPSPFRENQICVPWRRARLSVRPGITGLWQVCRQRRSAGDFHQWIYYDMLYVRHLSLWLDAKIVLATLLTLGGKWSVPLSWMISTHDSWDQTDLAVPSRTVGRS
jgi:lipopolysaccharide/colanic/teichoic acid biosynthesis glycosyltransferase